MKAQVLLTDTTLRDGEQRSGFAMTRKARSGGSAAGSSRILHKLKRAFRRWAAAKRMWFAASWIANEGENCSVEPDAPGGHCTQP
jgi:hypothetical protein